MGLPTGAQSPRPLGVLTCQRRYGHALTKTIQMFDRLVLSSPLSPESAANDAIWLDLRADVRLCTADAGWSSSVAHWAHNPEVTGSNPVPATSRWPGQRRFPKAFGSCLSFCLERLWAICRQPLPSCQSRRSIALDEHGLRCTADRTVARSQGQRRDGPPDARAQDLQQ